MAPCHGRQPDRCLLLLPGGGPAHAGKAQRQDHQHLVQQRTPGDADGVGLQRVQGGCEHADQGIGPRMGRLRGKRQRPGTGRVPHGDDLLDLDGRDCSARTGRSYPHAPGWKRRGPGRAGSLLSQRGLRLHDRPSPVPGRRAHGQVTAHRKSHGVLGTPIGRSGSSSDYLPRWY